MGFHLCAGGVWEAAASLGVAGLRLQSPAKRQCLDSGNAVQRGGKPALALFGRGGFHGAQGSLPEALRRFREAGSRRLALAGLPRNADDTNGTTPWEPLWSAACSVVESLLLGVESHVPGIVEHSAVADDTVVLRVRFRSGPCHGEIATRSRLNISVCLEQVVRVELRAPVDSKDPVVLNITGLRFLPLPEVTSLRERLQQEMGADFTKESAYDWWVKNKSSAYPLETSKLHRCWESLFSLRAVQLAAGLEQRQDAFWTYLHAVGVNVQSFELRYDESHEVKMTATRRPPPTSADDEHRLLVKTFDNLCRRSLRHIGDNMRRYAPSGYNFLSLFYGPQVGSAGACPQKIAKLLSAASFWGPGADGWRQWDRTWCCVDEQDWLSRVVKEQGRVVWQEACNEGTDIDTVVKARDMTALISSAHVAAMEVSHDEGSPRSLVPRRVSTASCGGDTSFSLSSFARFERSDIWPLQVWDTALGFVGALRSAVWP